MEATLMDKFADPALFDTLTSSEKTMGAFVTTCMGMGITFAVLILLFGAVFLMSKALNSKNSEQKPLTFKRKTVKKPVVTKLNDDSHLENAQLVAAIIAAIEAYEGKDRQQGEKVVVRKITRLAGNSWGNAGVNECNMSRKMY
ncbi:MAG: OadG family protein [Aminipila sp.]